MDVNASKCIDCDAGRFSTKPVHILCSCIFGFEVSLEKTYQTPCPLGKYKPDILVKLAQHVQLATSRTPQCHIVRCHCWRLSCFIQVERCNAANECPPGVQQRACFGVHGLSTWMVSAKLPIYVMPEVSSGQEHTWEWVPYLHWERLQGRTIG